MDTNPEENTLKVSTATAALHTKSSSTLAPTTVCHEKGVTETSMELSRNSTATTPSSAHRLNPFDTDVEAATRSCEHLNSKSPSGQTLKGMQDCPVWPGQEHWKRKNRQAKIKNSRSCQCMAKLDKRTKIIVKILIALVVIGIAVGVGLGISRKLDAPIWKPKDQ